MLPVVERIPTCLAPSPVLSLHTWLCRRHRMSGSSPSVGLMAPYENETGVARDLRGIEQQEEQPQGSKGALGPSAHCCHQQKTLLLRAEQDFAHFHLQPLPNLHLNLTQALPDCSLALWNVPPPRTGPLMGFPSPELGPQNF